MSHSACNRSGVRCRLSREQATDAELLAIQVVEAHAGRREAQVDCAGWAIALLGNDQFGDVLAIFGHGFAFFG